MGLGVGAVHRPRHRSPGRDAGRKRADAVRRQDPLEGFQNDFGVLGFSRTPAAPGTGTNAANRSTRTAATSTPRTSMAAQAHGWTGCARGWPATETRRTTGLAADGRDYLPRRTRARAGGRPTDGPDGGAGGAPEKAVVAGDVRANENVVLTAIHTLFAREHNRIVARSPARALRRGQVPARPSRRRRGGAVHHLQRVPACARRGLDAYRGYNPNVNPALANEFATVGYRAHSMIHGEFEPTVPRAPIPRRALPRLSGARESRSSGTRMARSR